MTRQAVVPCTGRVLIKLAHLHLGATSGPGEVLRFSHFGRSPLTSYSETWVESCLMAYPRGAMCSIWPARPRCTSRPPEVAPDTLELTAASHSVATGSTHPPPLHEDLLLRAQAGGQTGLTVVLRPGPADCEHSGLLGIVVCCYTTLMSL
ncbi:hypothetical protein NDU88_004159 [Pleurodeles waltl]|uniref:Uncharacterized protein n=1 Tax=Pleurodeles waltl TaxID=8319 RepID=A0AAV7T6W6_PLEWA|nr:hypothetical protein NDU88_004159 [Pleurodeles waltl]